MIAHCHDEDSRDSEGEQSSYEKDPLPASERGKGVKRPHPLEENRTTEESRCTKRLKEGIERTKDDSLDPSSLAAPLVTSAAGLHGQSFAMDSYARAIQQDLQQRQQSNALQKIREGIALLKEGQGSAITGDVTSLLKAACVEQGQGPKNVAEHLQGGEHESKKRKLDQVQGYLQRQLQEIQGSTREALASGALGSRIGLEGSPSMKDFARFHRDPDLHAATAPNRAESAPQGNSAGLAGADSVLGSIRNARGLIPDMMGRSQLTQPPPQWPRLLAQSDAALRAVNQLPQLYPSANPVMGVTPLQTLSELMRATHAHNLSLQGNALQESRVLEETRRRFMNEGLADQETKALASSLLLNQLGHGNQAQMRQYQDLMGSDRKMSLADLIGNRALSMQQQQGDQALLSRLSAELTNRQQMASTDYMNASLLQALAARSLSDHQLATAKTGFASFPNFATRKGFPNDAEELQNLTCPLATGEDNKWLSTYLCFVRSEFLEVFRADGTDVATRICTKRVYSGQVGIRCRFCTHLNPRDRARRSSSFPSSISRIYQSLTMMLRDHFPKCTEIPAHLKSKFEELRLTTTPGATDSKHFWISSAKDIGLIDTEGKGIGVDMERFKAHCKKSFINL
mmetsp:Transcript_28861/g.44347  ORF Transcript_28861/g.44347 Transcript_28861/m.44347 type:complete len:628 (-) Transcript_28861:333-2216(-)